MSLIHEMCFEWLTCLWFTVDVTYQICMVGPLCGCSAEIAAIMSHTRGTRAFEVRLRGPVSLSSLYTQTAGRPSSAGAGLGRLSIVRSLTGHGAASGLPLPFSGHPEV